MSEAETEEAVQRLERRLKREREARLAAEKIAETGLRDLYEKKRHLRLLENVAVASNQSASVADTLKFALDQVCEFAAWPLGHVYLVGDGMQARALSSTLTWHAQDSGEYAAFRAASEEARFEFGVGLPGRAAETGAAVWVSDVVEDKNFPRADLAKACGLHAAFAFPVLVGQEVVAILEFFSPQLEEPDDALMRTVASIGAQLGRVIERSRAETRLKQHNTELERLFADAEAQRSVAEAASRAKSAFLAVTSHEIRTPLNAVLGLAEALRREPLTERQAELNDGVLDSGRMLMRLLDAVLDLSKIEAGRITPHLKPFDLAHRVETVARVWQAQADKLGVAIVLDLDGLPQPCALVSDEGKFEQTLVNLLSNAMKFSPPGGRVLVRSAAVAVDGVYTVRVEVHDQGPGVPEAERERIFQPFEQTEVGREAGGAGLGLAICSGNVRLLDGRMGTETSQAGESLFWFEFPAQSHAGQPAAAEAVAEGAPETELDRPLKVLAAEDNAANRQVLKVLLEPVDLSLTFAVNGREALDAVGREAFDVILMDANMPVMGGLAATRAIRAMDGPVAATPIFMLTANVFEEDVRSYRAAGVDGVLKKPIDIQDLYAALQQAAGVAAVAERRRLAG